MKTKRGCNFTFIWDNWKKDRKWEFNMITKETHLIKYDQILLYNFNVNNYYVYYVIHTHVECSYASIYN